jgi:phenolic acid decarboxylase
MTMLLLACGQTKKSENLNLPERLIGVEMRYTYSEGNEYAVKFEEDGLSYQYRSGRLPERWWGTFEYNHMITENKEHLVSWHEPIKGDYVTLLINFENNLLYGSAIIGLKKVHFQTAEIHEIKLP